MRKAPPRIETERLVLRRPVAADARDVFERFASDPVATRYMIWPRHRALRETERFLELADDAWMRWPAGPYLIARREGGQVIGSTGFAFETLECAVTGYILTESAWGRGLATEALRAVVEVAESLPLERLYATCHVEHEASRRVLEKCGFEREATWPRSAEFPNLEPGKRLDVYCYARLFASPGKKSG